MRTIRIDLSLEQGEEFSNFLEGLGSNGYLISFEKGMVTSKDHWQGWIDWNPLQKDDTMYRKLTSFAKGKGLTQGQYAFSVMKDGEDYFSYICKHKGKDFIKKYTSYSDDVLQAQYDKANQWLSKQEHLKELKKIPFLSKVIEECKKTCLYIVPTGTGPNIFIRYDLIRDQVCLGYSDFVKAFDQRELNRSCIGVANHFERTFSSFLFHRPYVNHFLSGKGISGIKTIDQLFHDRDNEITWNKDHFEKFDLFKSCITLYTPDGLSSSSSNSPSIQASDQASCDAEENSSSSSSRF